jgi:ribosomal protein S20
MPVKHAAAKSLRQSKKRAESNATVKTQLRYLVKHTRRTIELKKTEEAKALLAKTIRAYDKAAQNGVVKKNSSGRMISRLTLRLNALIKGAA